jgi:predicted AAA+ superfamily ATPase
MLESLEDSVNYFDLEDPASLARLDEPMTALRPLKGLVVIDDVQRRPDLFPVLRVLSDRTDPPARYLVLGSASGNLMRQTSESLAGRMERIAIPKWVHHAMESSSSRCYLWNLMTRLAFGQPTRGQKSI